MPPELMRELGISLPLLRRDPHYFLPTTYGLEKTDMTVFNDRFWGAPFHQVSRPLVAPPGDALDEQRYLMALAQRLGVAMTYHGVEIDTANPPTDLQLLDLQFPQGTTRVPVADIAAAPGGKLYPEYAEVEVTPAMEGFDARFQFGNLRPLAIGMAPPCQSKAASPVTFAFATSRSTVMSSPSTTRSSPW